MRPNARFSTDLKDSNTEKITQRLKNLIVASLSFKVKRDHEERTVYILYNLFLEFSSHLKIMEIMLVDTTVL